jgi:hypothetical protein
MIACVNQIELKLMNSESDYPISNHLLLSELRLTIDNVIMLIDNASGQSDSFEVVESNTVDEANSKMKATDAIKFMIFSKTDSSSSSSENSGGSKLKATLEVHYNRQSNMIKYCSYIISPQSTEIETQGELYDFLMVALCPSLCLIRSIMYLIETCKKGMDPKQVDKELSISIQSDEHTPNSIIFCIKGRYAFLNIRLSNDQSHLTCFLNGNLDHRIQLPSISSHEKNFDSLEWGFDGTHHANRAPHSKTSEGMRIIFGLLGIDYVKNILISYAIQQQQINSLKMERLHLSDASSDGEEHHHKRANNTQKKRNESIHIG